MKIRIFLERLKKNLNIYTEHNNSATICKAAQTLIKNIDKQIADLPKSHPNGKKIPAELSDKIAEMLHTAIMLHHSEDGHDSDVVYDGTDEVGLSEMNDEELVEEFLTYFYPSMETDCLKPEVVFILKELITLGYNISFTEKPAAEDKELQCIEDGERRMFDDVADQFHDEDWWGSQYEKVKTHFKQPCTVVCLNTFTALGDLRFEYYDIRFDDGVTVEAVSGVHLQDKVE